MSVKITKPQAVLLSELYAAGDRGVIKSTSYTPAESLVSMGLAKWAARYNNGISGKLVITEGGTAFKGGGNG